MSDHTALHALATALGVYTRYTDGLGNVVEVGAETLERVCAAIRTREPPESPAGFAPVIVAWNGMLHLTLPGTIVGVPVLQLEHGETVALHPHNGEVVATLPMGYHRLVAMVGDAEVQSTVIASPVEAYRGDGTRRGWGVSAQLAALRSLRSRSVGDLHDLETLTAWVRRRGGNLVALLPLLPTFNTTPTEPSPYSPVSRLFWSELMLNLGPQHHATGPAASLDVAAAHREVWAALKDQPVPGHAWQDPELVRYARFRGAQARLGRNWRDWPQPARAGALADDHVDPDVVRFHLTAEAAVREQLHALRERCDARAVRLGLDLTVGVHPDGYDAWSRQHLFAASMSVGAPPDPGFPSGQDWGFSPILPTASRAEGHRYVAQSLAHQMAIAGVLRVDHIMAFARLYWIPHGMALHQGTYVSYPMEELFAVLTLESQRHHCEVLGEDLGTVPAEIHEALGRHRIWGMYLAQFHATGDAGVTAPGAEEVALIGSHDTPTLAGWLAGEDIQDRLTHGLLSEDEVAATVQQRETGVARLAAHLGVSPANSKELLVALLVWLGRSPAPLVLPWLEDLWLEVHGVNVPGTPSSARGNWQRPMGRLLDDVLEDPEVITCLQALQEARTAHP